MSALSQALAAEAAKGQRRPECGVKALMARLPKREAQELRDALEGPLPHAVITRALAGLGHKLADTTIGRHRRGGCSCDR